MTVSWFNVTNGTEHLTTVGQLGCITQAILRDMPFLHVRFNDGECNTIFRLRKENATTSGEHRHFRDLGDALLAAFREVCQKFETTLYRPITIVGSYWFAEPEHPGAIQLVQWMRENHIDTSRILWGMSDFWYDAAPTSCKEHWDAMRILLESLEAEASNGRRVVLVGNPLIRPARKCLRAEFIEVPQVDCWLKRESILAEAAKHAERDARTVFVWCAGMPSKVFATRIFNQYPQTSHIDAGHLFDLAFGIANRMWMVRGNSGDAGPHYEIYRDKFIPFVHGR